MVPPAEERPASMQGAITEWSEVMKTLMLAAIAALTLGIHVASAQQSGFWYSLTHNHLPSPAHTYSNGRD